MSKLYRVTTNMDNLTIEVDDPSGHYYKEYIGITDLDSSNPIREDFASIEEAQESINQLKNRYALEQDEFLSKYYNNISHPEDKKRAKLREVEIISDYQYMKNKVIPALKVVECTLKLEVKEV